MESHASMLSCLGALFQPEYISWCSWRSQLLPHQKLISKQKKLTLSLSWTAYPLSIEVMEWVHCVMFLSLKCGLYVLVHIVPHELVAIPRLIITAPATGTGLNGGTSMSSCCPQSFRWSWCSVHSLPWVYTQTRHAITLTLIRSVKIRNSFNL